MLLGLVRCSLIKSYSTYLTLLGTIGMAIPHLLTMIKTNPNTDLYGFVFYGLCVFLNTMVTILIALRLFMMRHKTKMVLGNLQASLYNSCISVFVESGAFFSIWSLIYLALRAKGSWAQDIFFQPYSFVLVSFYCPALKAILILSLIYIGPDKDAHHSSNGSGPCMDKGDHHSRR